MRFLHIVGVFVAMGAVATAFLGWNGAVLAIGIGVLVLIFLFIASEPSASGRRVDLYDLLWGVARVGSTVVGFALGGWLVAVGLFVAVLVLEGMARALRRSRSEVHPDEVEAREWVEAQVNRLRSMSYPELLAQLDEPVHYDIRSRTGRVLMGETQVFWDSGEEGPLRVMVDVCEPKPGIVSSIASEDFIRGPDGSFVGE
jgi:hypothetical protein